MITHPIEGDELLLKDGSLWIVKGCYHLRNEYVAVPRVVNGKKIKTYEKQLEHVKRYYLHYIKYIPQIGFPTPLVPLKDLGMYISITQVSSINKSHLKSLGLELRELVQDECRTECGLTGSLLGKYSGKGSDIDLVCIDNADFPECLKKLRDEGLLPPITGKDFVTEYPEVKELINQEIHKELIRFKLTQGLFKGVKYTLKAINCEREKQLLGPYTFIYKGEILVKLLSTDYRAPSIYNVQVLRPCSNVRNAYLLTHRVRLTELPKNSLVGGKGSILYKGMNSVIISFDRPPSNIEFVAVPK